MEHVYILFEMVRASAVFVVADGELKGMISRDRLLDSLKPSASLPTPESHDEE
jgi:hypothetical protein